ncbi:hypothetical protein BS47DRAFT_1396363 [Hydnum rufescens UP504]|uniref:Uncharacterized protein n=1 Tax=Hydnum rufescens UP504 TaxID=1448309 RepID=A0A9P6AQ89_9AGAM|nr:hypothetical protein BS47DRAFT_1396363 [Hydnum rufescens UP504]
MIWYWYLVLLQPSRLVNSLLASACMEGHLYVSPHPHIYISSFRHERLCRLLFLQHQSTDYLVSGGILSLEKPKIYQTDVFIAGSDWVSHRLGRRQALFTVVFVSTHGCTYARYILDGFKIAKVIVAGMGSHGGYVPSDNVIGSIQEFRKVSRLDFGNAAYLDLEPISVFLSDTLQSTLSRDSWSPGRGVTLPNKLVIRPKPKSSPREEPSWHQCRPNHRRNGDTLVQHFPHEGESANNPIDKADFKELLKAAKTVLNVHDDQFDIPADNSFPISIRDAQLKEILQSLPGNRSAISILSRVERRRDNQDYVTWAGPNTILSRVPKERFTLWTETSGTAEDLQRL